MKTKTIHTVAIVVLSVMAIINVYADHKDSQLLFKYQLEYIQNRSEIASTLISYPVMLEAVRSNRDVNQSIFKNVLKIENQVNELIEHTNYKIEESNKVFLEKLRADPKHGKSQDVVTGKPTQSFSRFYGTTNDRVMAH